MGRKQPVTIDYFAHGGHPKAGAASRPIAGKLVLVKFFRTPITVITPPAAP